MKKIGGILTDEQLSAFEAEYNHLADYYNINPYKSKNGWIVVISSKLLEPFFINNNVKLQKFPDTYIRRY
jgi:hypothetical protein